MRTATALAKASFALGFVAPMPLAKRRARDTAAAVGQPRIAGLLIHLDPGQTGLQDVGSVHGFRGAIVG